MPRPNAVKKIVSDPQLAKTEQVDKQNGANGKKKRISKRIRKAVDLLLSGECRTQKAAAAHVGMNPDYLSRALSESHIREYVTRKSRQTIHTMQLRAVSTLDRLMDAESEHVSKDVAIHTLAIAGIKPEESRGPSVNIAINPGYVIDLRHDQPAKVIDVPSTDITPSE